MEAHGGYLSRYEDVDTAWLARLAGAALEEDGQPIDDCGLLVTVLPGPRVVRFAFDGAHSYGRAGARWYLAHHAFARRLSEHLNTAVHAYVFDPDDLESVVSYGNGRHVGGETLRYEDAEMPDGLDDEDSSFELMKNRWPLGHLAKVLGVRREELIRLPRQKTALLDLSGEVPAGPLWHLFPHALTQTLRRHQTLSP
ncbi:MAG: hypothetical protein IPJ65_08670 [Archangiaceae bacterium]|nr:hypothetical protein [Archangiaceae bacterium]